MRYWWDKESEKIKGVPLSRVPEIDMEERIRKGITTSPDARRLECRLEEALMEIDRLRSERDGLARDTWNYVMENYVPRSEQLVGIASAAACCAWLRKQI